MKLIDGKKIAERIKDEIALKILEECDKKNKNRPNLAIILVGNRSDSKLYVDLKIKEAKKVGIDTHLYNCEKNIKERELINLINFLNNDKLINAILIQLPLPEHLDTDKIIKIIKPKKDADGFHPDNLKIFLSSGDQKLLPPVYAVIKEILDEIKFKIENKETTIIANSKTFGKNLGKVLENLGSKVTITSSKAKNLSNITKKADLLISAVGKPEFIDENFIKNKAIIIDIGITKVNNKVKGDVNQKSVKNKASYLTPVPGGVGPITIAMLFKNTLRLYSNSCKDL